MKMESKYNKRDEKKDFIKYFSISVIALFGFYIILLIVLPEKIGNTGYQDVGNLIQGTFGVAVALAGAFVAIYLAKNALTIAENEKHRAYVADIQKITQDTRDITYGLIGAYKSCRYHSYELVIEYQKNQRPKIELEKNYQALKIELEGKYKESKIELEGNIEALENWMNKSAEKLKKSEIELEKKLEKSMNEFAEKLRELENNCFAYNAYINGFDSTFNYELPTYIGNFFTDAKKITELSFQIEKFPDLHNNALLFLNQKQQVINSKFSKEKSDEERQKKTEQIVSMIFLGYYLPLS